MRRDEIIDAIRLRSAWLSEAHGWRPAPQRLQFAQADVVVENEERMIWIVNVVQDEDSDAASEDAMYLALGKLVPMMTADIKVNSLGFAEPDAQSDPTLVRFALAVPDTDAWRKRVGRIPLRVRKLLQLSLALVSQGNTRVHLPSVPVKQPKA